ncbi:hypothetical protein MTO96_015531 [Rhipicephalus appendiculatus]
MLTGAVDRTVPLLTPLPLRGATEEAHLGGRSLASRLAGPVGRMRVRDWFVGEGRALPAAAETPSRARPAEE